MRPIILGEAPARKLAHKHESPLWGTTARWLCQHAGLEPSFEYSLDGQPHASELDCWYRLLRSQFRPVNAIATFEAAYPWTNVTRELAKARVMNLIADWWEDDATHDDTLVVIALGRNAQDALPNGSRSKPFFTWTLHPRACYVTIPHPSGLNHLYNAPENHESASRVLRESLEYARVGH